MSKKNKVFVSFLLDETGSMLSCRDETISGFNEYVQSLASDKDSDYKFTLTLFNSEKVEIRHYAVDVSKVNKLTSNTYAPTSMTPLYDAIAKSIAFADAEVKKKDRVVFVIMTDGEENSSKEYTLKAVREMIEDRQKNGWKFLFLGADIDSYAVGGSLGVDANTISNYSKKSTGDTMSRVASISMSYASSGDLSLTDEDRKAMTGS